MTEKDTRSGQAADLRRQAEEIIRQTATLSPENLEAMSSKEMLQTIHELRVHQIELNTQNEELCRKQAELDAAGARYFDFYDLAPVGYVTVSKEKLILEANLSTARMLGVARRDMFKQPFSKYIFKEDQDIYYLHREQIIKTGEPQKCELRMVKNDGTAFWTHLATIAVYGPEGDPVYRTVISDITQSKNISEQLLLAKKVAEEANLAKSVFVANMSHEIRTPLNAILGFAQVMERDPSLTSEQAENVQMIIRSGAHLLRLLGDILDMSKIESGRIAINESVFCLHDLLNELKLMFRSRVSAQGLQLLMEWDAASIPRYVVGDEGKLRQVLANLMGNAVKFTVTGGIVVRVRADAVIGKAGEDETVLRLVVEVEDTGPGISTGEIDRIFGYFQQGCAGVKAGGTGLGLTISRKFVEMMGGELTVTSQVGKGSCFRFQVLLKPTVEVADQDKSPSRRIIGLKPGTGPFRILVVDDAPTNRVLLCTLLQPVGFEVAEASNGVEALAVFDKWSPSAILMDMRMPLMDGYEATRRLKSTEAGRATPVIAVTASIFADSKDQVTAAGVDVYLKKPFKVKELFDVLEKCLGLQYVFADETDKIPSRHPEPASLVLAVPLALPKKLTQAMRKAVEEGDINQLTELIVQVERFDSVKARVLQSLADEYDYTRLGQWLEKEGSDI